MGESNGEKGDKGIERTRETKVIHIKFLKDKKLPTVEKLWKEEEEDRGSRIVRDEGMSEKQRRTIWIAAALWCGALGK